MPIAFIPQGESFVPTLVLGLKPEQNLFVTADGRWISTYIPAQYRGYPFALVKTDANELVLSVDIDSGLVAEHFPEPFFDEYDEPSKLVQQILHFLGEVSSNQEATLSICSALRQANLIVPWQITMKAAGGEQIVQGLYRIDEARFENLGAEELHHLHRAGALPLVYCQLLSMQHIHRLTALAVERASACARPALDELNLDFLSQTDSLNFGS